MIDLKSRSITATWPNGCKGARGIALDGERDLLFVGCAEGKAVVLDAASGHEVSAAQTGDGVDIIDYSAKTHHLFIPGGKSATMAIFDVGKDGKLSLLTTVPTAMEAHCVAVDASGIAYVCDPKAGRLLIFSSNAR